MNKIKSIVTDFFAHWKVPAEGHYVSNKEIVAYSAGGMGVQFIMAMVGQIAMTASCILIGSVYGIKPFDLGILSMVATFFALVLQPLKGYLIDNTRGKKGKARPYIFWLGPPTVVLVILFSLIPMSWTYSQKLISIGVLFCLLNFVANFYLGMYTQLAQLLTPNTDERAGIISVSSIVYSLAPTITGALLPLIADPLGGLTNITVYRIVFPIFCLIGVALGYVAYFGTKERIVVAKRYVVKMKFWDGFKKICTNKYFWIVNVSSWFAFAKGALLAIMTWSYIYTLQNNQIFSVMTLIMGTASLVGMLVSPFIIKLIGKKNTVIATNILYAVACILVFFCINNFVLTAILFYVLYFTGAVQIITAPAMNADTLDYQQWKSGDRLEGFAGNFSMIGSVLGMGTGLVIPAIYQMYGLIDNYDVLYDPSIRTPMYKMLIIISAIGTIFVTLPYIFYDLSEKKHKLIIADLKERALEQNKEDGIIESNDELEAELAGITLDEYKTIKEADAKAQLELNNAISNDTNDKNSIGEDKKDEK